MSQSITTTVTHPPGIDYRADLGRWRARIQINGKRRVLGYYDTQEQALEAYARGKLIGEIE